MNLPLYENIPDVGLYLDQITKYINYYLEKDNQLTGSMITNYVKLKIVPRGIKKTYSRKHIAQFMLIACFKYVLSMEQIKKVFDTSNKNIEEMYKCFVDSGADDEVLKSLYANIEAKIELDRMIANL